MAHELEIVNGEAKMMYAKDGGVPWHRLGTAVDYPVTSEEAGKLAGLDWNITKNPLYTRVKIDGQWKYQRVDGKYATVRENDGKVLGLVAEEYDTVSNREAFELVDKALAEVGVEARYTTAGSLRGGKQVFMTAVLPETFSLGKTKFGTEDRQQFYLFLHTGHDGGTPVDVFPTSVRAVCANTVHLSFATRASGILEGTSFWHKGLREDNILSHAKSRVVNSLRAMREYRDTAEALADTSVTEDIIEEFRNVIIPPVAVHPHKKGVFKDPDLGWREFVPEANFNRAAKAYDSKIERYNYVAREEAESGWGLFCIATGYADHQRYHAWKRPETNLNTTMFGAGADIKTRAYDFLRNELLV